MMAAAEKRKQCVKLEHIHLLIAITEMSVQIWICKWEECISNKDKLLKEIKSKGGNWNLSSTACHLQRIAQ